MWRSLIVGIFVVPVHMLSAAQLAPPADQVPASPVACGASVPVASPGDRLGLKVWPPSAYRGVPLVVEWASSVGTVAGAPLTWDIPSTLSPRDEGEVAEATATLTKDGTELGRCTAKVLIVPPAKPISIPERSLLSGRTIVSSGQQPEGGYGLYGYLLLTRPPTDETTRLRYVAAIESFVARILPAQELEHYRRRSDLSVVVVFVRSKVDADGDLADAKVVEKVAAEILSKYDYARAAALAATIGIDTTAGGPYLATAISATATAESGVVLDVSRVAPRLVTDWVAAFCTLTSQPATWSNALLVKTGLTMRNILAYSADATPDVTSSIASWLKIGKSLGK